VNKTTDLHSHLSEARKFGEIRTGGVNVAVWKASSMIAMAGVLAVAVTGCGQSPQQTNKTTTQPAVHEGGSITINSASTAKDLDPAKAFDAVSSELVFSMYEPLVTYQGYSTKIVPLLAKSWTISPDGKTYTFHLQPNVKFWNGDPLTSQSFVDEFDRILTKSFGSPLEGFLNPVIQGSEAYFDGKAKTVTGLSTPNSQTLVIKLSKPEPFFLQVLAMPMMSAVDNSWIQKEGAQAFDANKPMGTGPFELKTLSSNQIVLSKNPNYWGKDSAGNTLPYLDKVTINVTTNTSLNAVDFQAGKIAFIGNLLSGISSQAWPQFMSNAKLKSSIVNVSAGTTWYLGLNNSIKPLNNKLVRQAIEYAVDKNGIKKLMNNRVQVANQPLPPNITGYMKTLPAAASYSYNPTKAKQLLAQAGYPNGFSTTLYVMNDSDSMRIGQSIQSQLQQVGIKAQLKTEYPNIFFDQNSKGNVQPIFLSAWGQDYPDASDFLNTLFNSNQRPFNNATMYSNPQVDTWLTEAQTDMNTTQRYQLYDKVTTQVMADAAWVPLYYPVFNYAVQPWVHGYVRNTSLPENLKLIWIDPGH